MDITEKISPFFWVDHEDGTASLCLYAGDYKADVFAARSDEGFLGNGYDWNSLAMVFIDEKMPEIKGQIDADPEAGMFCVYSSSREALEKFALAFKSACEDDVLIRDLFSRAELD